MRIVFMGTPEFSVPALLSLIEAGHDVAAAVTQPDRKKGRGQSVLFSPVKEAALKAGISVLQPEKVREEAFLNQMKEIAPDAIVVAAFGQILPSALLALPPYGCINIHASLLPKYRGASPIVQAVLDGERVSGVTTMYMAEGLDTGDILLKEEVALASDETGGSLHDKLSLLGGPLILKTLEGLLNGTLKGTPQKEKEATYTKRIAKEDGTVDFAREAAVIERQIRGLNPWPSAYTHIEGRILKLWSADIVADKEGEIPGTITEVLKDAFIVKTGKDSLRVKEVQLEGKRRMPTAEFLKGFPLEKGTVLQ